MDLIERYLQAVQFWLPKAQKDDIIAELSEDLHAQMEEQESELGRPLEESEVEKILKRRGRPVLVANRFLPQKQLIGPVLFPIYVFALKIVTACYLIPGILVWAGRLIYSVHYRVEFSSHWFASLGEMWGRVLTATLLALGATTLIFAILERLEAKSHFLERWEPRKLPKVRNPTLIPRSGSSFEVAGNLVFLLCCYRASAPVLLLNLDAHFTLAPRWAYFYWGYLLLAAINIALAIVNLLRPYWTLSRATLRLLTDATGAFLFCWMLKSNLLAGLEVPNMPAARAQEIVRVINSVMASAFPFSIAVGIVIVGAGIYRLVRLKSVGVHPKLQAMAH